MAARRALGNRQKARNAEEAAEAEDADAKDAGVVKT